MAKKLVGQSHNFALMTILPVIGVFMVDPIFLNSGKPRFNRAPGPVNCLKPILPKISKKFGLILVTNLRSLALCFDFNYLKLYNAQAVKSIFIQENFYFG